MIKINDKTEKYTIHPETLIGESFDKAYERTLETMPQSAPDKATTISGSISLILLAVVLFATGYGQPLASGAPDTTMLFLGAVCILVLIFLIYRYIKKYSLYKKAAGAPNERVGKKDEFYKIFGDLPDEMLAMDLIKKISPKIGRQQDASFNEALKYINEVLTLKNNPGDMKCKLINQIKEVFTQPRRRLYFSQNDDRILLYDCDFEEPIGEIVCDWEDVSSFGRYSEYSGRINASGGKIQPDSVILELKDANYDLFFEFQADDYNELKKVLPRAKELK